MNIIFRYIFVLLVFAAGCASNTPSHTRYAPMGGANLEDEVQSGYGRGQSHNEFESSDYRDILSSTGPF